MRKIGIYFPSRGRAAFYEIGEPPTSRGSEVLIETELSGVTNGTERQALLGLHIWNRAFPGYHGYQHVGRVVEKGDEVSGFDVGDPVFYGRYVGHRGWNIQDLSQADEQSYSSHLVVRLPDGGNRAPFALLGVAGVAMRAVRRLRIDRDQKVWVVGAGPIGLFAAQIARHMGAEVTVSEIAASRISVAKNLGLRVLDSSTSDAPGKLEEYGPFDRILDTSGWDGLLPQIHAHRLLNHAGAIGLIGVRSNTCFEWSMLHSTEGSVEVSCHFSIADLRLVIELMRTGRLKVVELITHKVPVEQALEVYEILRDRPHSLLGVVFDWG